MYFLTTIMQELNPYYASLSNMCVIGTYDIENEPDKFDMNIYILNNAEFKESFTITGVDRRNILNWHNDISYLIDYVEELIELYQDSDNEDLKYITNGLQILLSSIYRYWCVFICNDKTPEPALIGVFEYWLSDLAITTNIRNYITATTGKVFHQELQRKLLTDIQKSIGPYLLDEGKALIN